MLDAILSLALEAGSQHIKYLKRSDLRPPLSQAQIVTTTDDFMPTITDDDFMVDTDIKNQALSIDAIRLNQQNAAVQEANKASEEAKKIEDGKKLTSTVVDKIGSITGTAKDTIVSDEKIIEKDIRDDSQKTTDLVLDKAKDITGKIGDVVKDSTSDVSADNLKGNIANIGDTLSNVGEGITGIGDTIRGKITGKEISTIDKMENLVVEDSKKDMLKDVKIVEIKSNKKEEEKKPEEKLEIIKGEITVKKDDVKMVEDALEKTVGEDKLPNTIEKTFSEEVSGLTQNKKTEDIIDKNVLIPEEKKISESKLTDINEEKSTEDLVDEIPGITTPIVKPEETKKKETASTDSPSKASPESEKTTASQTTSTTTTASATGTTTTTQTTSGSTPTEEQKKEEEVVVQYKEDVNYKNYLSRDDKMDLEIVMDTEKPPPNIIPRKKELDPYVVARMPRELISDERTTANAHIPIVMKEIDMQEMARKAIDEDNIDVLRAVINTIKDPNYTLDNRETALNYACTKRRYRIIYYLLYIGADINKKDQKRNTPLHAAVKSNDLVAVNIMLQRNADVNTRDVLNNTPLHTAIEKGYINIAYVLIEAGANLNLVNSKKDTPLDTAKKYQRKEIENLLLRKMGKL